MAKKKFPFKDPDEDLDYEFRWVDRLDGDTIASVTYTITGPDSALTKHTETFTSTVAKLWLTGGTLTKTYAILCHIVTTAGRTMEQTGYIKIKAK